MIRHAPAQRKKALLRTALLLLTFALPASAQQQVPPNERSRPAESVVAGMSHDDIDITTSFDGSDIIIYGAIKRETAIPQGSPLDVIVAVQGPARPVTVRRKSRHFGIWINTASVSIGAAPDFYVVATTRALDKILSPEQDARYRVGVPQAVRSFGGALTVDDPVPFTEALVRQREETGLYRLDEGAVKLIEQTLFRADVQMPANLVEGVYSTRILLVRDGEVLDVYRAPISVRKVGLELWLYRMALVQPFLYGIMSLAIAIAAGWLASVAFRALKRT